MNIILFSRRLGRAQQIELTRPVALCLMAGVIVAILAGTFYVGMLAGRGPLGVDQQVLAWRKSLADQRDAVGATRRELDERLDALASRVGQMNAHVIRIDALGRRLTEMAGLEKGEFDFGREPAAGGPEADDGAFANAPDLTSMLDQLALQIRDRERQLTVLESLISTKNLSKQLLPNGRPVVQGYVSSHFGHRADPFTGRRAFHRGIDFAGPAGSQVIAVAAGVVTLAEDEPGYGRTLEITHGNGYMTRYGHNASLLVQVGDTVQKGQPIALIGSTGRSTGPHLHFEVLRNGRQVDPMAFVRQQAKAR